MPSVKLELGKYVTVRPRVDGTFRVLFEVPPRLRPSGWSPAIPLPLSDARRRGDLDDGHEIAAIQRDAADLYAKLIRQRDGRSVDDKAGRRTIAKLLRLWQQSSSWADLKPRSIRHYQTYINHILRWSEVVGDPDPTLISRADVEKLLAQFPGQQTTKLHLRKTLRLIMDQAVAAGWRQDNPCAGIRIKAAPSKVMIWEQEDVDFYVKACREHGRPSLALIILLEWEIGQRITDVRAMRTGAEYNAATGAFSFAQSKTGASVTITVSETLRAMLATAGAGEMFLFRDEGTGKAYSEERLPRVFMAVRKASKGKPLVLRWLRHSCVVQLARAGCTPSEIAAVTGHALSSVVNILAIYLPRDGQVAANAQAKRGIA
jgi:hypothetical protein